ncbi:MAG TPA: hypothetical protein VK338_04865, partial [Candidatus Nitrosocosmicus sp.]|nr:hypothetical protein [Candidatus Nitrosocosmicus sp.]
VNASSIWILLFSILLIRYVRLDISLILGLMGGIFLLAKSNASMFLALSLFAPIIELGKNFKLKKIFNYYILFILSFIIAYLLYNIQRLSPFFHFVSGKNYTFILKPSEFLENPFQVFWPNVVNLPLFTFHNLGWATGFLGLYGLILLYKKNRNLALYISTWILLPYAFMSFFNRVLFSRYHIFILSFLLILAAYGLSYLYDKFKNKLLFFILLVVSFAFTLYFSYTVIFDAKKIPFLETDRGQYIEAWPAGWGAKEIVEYARQKSKEKPVLIVGEGDFGMSGDVLDTFLKTGDKIHIKGYWPLDEQQLLDNKKELDNKIVLVVFSHRSTFPPHWPIKLIKKYEKPGNKSAMYLFQLVESL